MNSRLLHATARGARIQSSIHDWGTDKRSGWIDDDFTELSLLRETHPNIRIHPDDEHLAYGPVSTNLRSYALTSQRLKAERFDDVGLCSVIVIGIDDRWGVAWEHQTEFERSLALLIMAEALADEGL